MQAHTSVQKQVCLAADGENTWCVSINMEGGKKKKGRGRRVLHGGRRAQSCCSPLVVLACHCVDVTRTTQIGAWAHLECDGLPGEGFDEDLHV